MSKMFGKATRRYKIRVFDQHSNELRLVDAELAEWNVSRSRFALASYIAIPVWKSLHTESNIEQMSLCSLNPKGVVCRWLIPLNALSIPSIISRQRRYAFC